MLKKLKQNKPEGFTIIEVLIVLAIAGLIILIVFLAVPALQRNSRNTQRKNDVSAILSAVGEFSNNNNGQLPNGTWTNSGGLLTIVGATGTSSSEAKVAFYTEGVGAASGNVNKVAAGTASPVNTLTTGAHDRVIVSTGTVCNGNISVVGSSRSVTAVYLIETGANKYSQQCQSS